MEAKTWADLWREILDGFSNPLFFIFSVAVGFGVAVLTHVMAGLLADPIVRQIRKLWALVSGKPPSSETELPVVVLRFRGGVFIPTFTYQLNRRHRWLSKHSIIFQKAEGFLILLWKSFLALGICIWLGTFLLGYFYPSILPQDLTGSAGPFVFGAITGLLTVFWGVFGTGMVWGFIIMFPVEAAILPLRFKARAIRRRWKNARGGTAPSPIS